MQKLSFSFFLLFFIQPVWAQPIPGQHPSYSVQTSQAFQLYINGRFREAALTYDSAFALSGGAGKAPDRYNAAFAWASAGDKEKAMLQLEKAAFESRFTELDRLEREGKLFKLDLDSSRWNKIITAVRKNKIDWDAKADTALIRRLREIGGRDQRYRLQLADLEQIKPFDQKKSQELWIRIRKNDSLNISAIKKILDTRGWLGADEVGEEGNATLFLVVQHADAATQEQYLPIMRKALADGKAKASHLALLEDRVRMNRGLKQLYGSQVIREPVTGQPRLYSIEDEKNVNKRRAAAGLAPLEDYARLLGIEYHPK